MGRKRSWAAALYLAVATSFGVVGIATFLITRGYDLGRLGREYIGGNANQDHARPPPREYTLATGAGAGYCRVDVTPTTMILRPTWINGTPMTPYALAA